MNRTISALLLCLFLCVQTMIAQTNVATEQQSIDEQFESLLKTSNNLRKY